MIIAIFIFLASLLYMVSFVQVSLGSVNDGKKHRAYAFAFVGFIFHTLALAIRFCDVGGVSLSTSYELLEFVMWIVVALQLFASTIFKIGLVGLFSMFATSLLTALPLGCPLFLTALSSSPTQSSSGLIVLHGLLVAIAYAFLGASAIFAICYLKQQKNLKQKILTKLLPSLQTLEKGLDATLSTSILAMMLSLFFGYLGTMQIEISDKIYIKFCVGAVIFICQILLWLLAVTGWVKKSTLSKLIVAIFVISLLLIVPIEILRR